MEHSHEPNQEVSSDDSHLVFKCPNCGEIERDDVMFLCNTCKKEDIIEKDGVFMCPSCLKPGENFECLICESTEVVMKEK